ncbi:MAG: adenosylcobinamide-GDP ribazoletransferase [Lachnospiraceae bacterium]|nr:adenosylcobinamide-GDP ribazoletransferase [Lachnospiraceae bacterium]
MRFLRCIATAILMYTRIPVPGFELSDDDMKNCIMFLPLTGVFIGAVIFALIRFLPAHGVPIIAVAMLAVVVPLLITGGFHVDGFMDTVDALSSYKDREQKLKILKDPHIGAFAVTGLATAGLIMIASFVVILNIEAEDSFPVILTVCSVFVISRALTVLTCVLMKKAKAEGMLAAETSGSRRAAVVASVIWLMTVLIPDLLLDPLCTAVTVAAFAVFMLYYRYMAYRDFGGVTGDTAGYFITAGEVVSVFAIAVFEVILHA